MSDPPAYVDTTTLTGMTTSVITSAQWIVLATCRDAGDRADWLVSVTLINQRTYTLPGGAVKLA